MLDRVIAITRTNTSKVHPVRLLVVVRVLLVTSGIVAEHCHVVHSRLCGVVGRDVVLGLDVAEAEKCWWKTGDGVVHVGDAEVAAGGGILDEICDSGMPDFGGSVGILLSLLVYVLEGRLAVR